jgi:hypothetical protein
MSQNTENLEKKGVARELFLGLIFVHPNFFWSMDPNRCKGYYKPSKLGRLYGFSAWYRIIMLGVIWMFIILCNEHSSLSFSLQYLFQFPQYHHDPIWNEVIPSRKVLRTTRPVKQKSCLPYVRTGKQKKYPLHLNTKRRNYQDTIV